MLDLQKTLSPSSPPVGLEISSDGLERDSFLHDLPPPCSPYWRRRYCLNDEELAAFRTQPCVHKALRRSCPHGDDCPHSHCLSWCRRDPRHVYYKSTLCPFVIFRKEHNQTRVKNFCSRGRLCPCSHTKEEQMYHPSVYKTKICRGFPECPRVYCPFAHGPEELRYPDWSADPPASSQAVFYHEPLALHSGDTGYRFDTIMRSDGDLYPPAFLPWSPAPLTSGSIGGALPLASYHTQTTPAQTCSETPLLPLSNGVLGSSSTFPSSFPTPACSTTHHTRLSSSVSPGWSSPPLLSNLPMPILTPPSCTVLGFDEEEPVSQSSSLASSAPSTRSQKTSPLFHLKRFFSRRGGESPAPQPISIAQPPTGGGFSGQGPLSASGCPSNTTASFSPGTVSSMEPLGNLVIGPDGELYLRIDILVR